MPQWFRKDEFDCGVFLRIHTVGKEDVIEKHQSKRSTVQCTFACSEEHKIIESSDLEVLNSNECVDEQ